MASLLEEGSPIARELVRMGDEIEQEGRNFIATIASAFHGLAIAVDRMQRGSDAALHRFDSLACRQQVALWEQRLADAEAEDQSPSRDQASTRMEPPGRQSDGRKVKSGGKRLAS